MTAQRYTLTRTGKLRRKSTQPEQAIQKSIVDALRKLGITVVAIPNEGKRTAHNGARMRAAGLTAGMPDLVLLLPESRCALLEVKTDKGKLSENQEAFRDLVLSLGVMWAVVRSIDDVLAKLEEWGVWSPRGRV